ncbi:Nucleoside-diphosphate-sugar epimerase [Giardia muris]|uniref:Nucleoside-diphosphate-sugar epimerase n=1 Tax=Giardia muris TaxID=5742 RepID=A0A4Z1T8P1_GIAMU|nr:Nucleoside-diphosphate-sugar epimerase [Giardia muris]|eukprot:TNJ30493.1 Nucleoside-diphosphate-sugar epimerase [Giardia muris]
MRVFLTGGTGFIGSAVLSRLLVAGHEVICTYRRAATLKELRLDVVPNDNKLRFRHCDITDPELVHKVIAEQDFDVLIHMACTSSWTELARTNVFSVALDGTKNLVNACQAKGRQPIFVYISSGAAAGAQSEIGGNLEAVSTNYANAKRKTEEYLLEHQNLFKKLIILRPAEVYAPNDIHLVTAGNLLEYARGGLAFIPRGGMAIVHRDDVADSIVNSLTRGIHGKIYYLGGPNVTLSEFARVIQKLTGKGAYEIPLHLPMRLLAGLIWLGKCLHLTQFDPNLAVYCSMYWFGDSTEAIQDLGHRVRTPDEVLRDAVQSITTGAL